MYSDKFKQTIIREWKELGFTHFRETIWTSVLQQVHLARIRRFFKENDIKNVDISIVIPPKNETPNLKWANYYETSGQCISTLRECFIPANSNNIKLTFCYKSDEEEKENEIQTLNVVNTLRLVFGVTVARKLLFIRHYSTDNNEPIMHSDKAFSSRFDIQELNMFNNPDIEDLKVMKIPEEANVLLESAFTQTFPRERFILLWIAFEVIINVFYKNENNGKKREKYFKNEIKSDIINEEVKRLFLVRCEMFKEGKVKSDMEIESEGWSLYSIIQLCIMSDCMQRDAFIKGYENTISNRKIKN